MLKEYSEDHVTEVVSGIEWTQMRAMGPPRSWVLKGYRGLGKKCQFSSFTKSCPTLCDPMDCSMPGFPVHHQLTELAQTHVHWASDAIQHLILCHPILLLPSVFTSIRVFSNESAVHIRWPKYWSFSFSIIQNWFPLGWTGWIPSQSKGLSRVLSNTTVQKNQFFGAQLSLWSNSHIHTWPLEKL